MDEPFSKFSGSEALLYFFHRKISDERKKTIVFIDFGSIMIEHQLNTFR